MSKRTTKKTKAEVEKIVRFLDLATVEVLRSALHLRRA